MIPSTDEQTESINNQKFCHICKEKLHDVGHSNDKDIDIRSFNGGGAGLDHVDDVHDDDSNDNEIDVKSFTVKLLGLMMFMIITLTMMMIAIMRKLASESSMVMLEGLMMIIIMTIMIAMMKKLTSESFMVMLQGFMMLVMITMIMMMMIATMRKLMPKSSMVMLRDLRMLILVSMEAISI